MTEILPLHSYCKNTLCHGKLQNAQAGSTVGFSRPGLAPRRPWWHPRVNCSSSGCVGLSHIGGSGSLGHHLENRSIHSHLSWFQCMKAKNLALSAPRASVWRRTRAKAVHTMPIPPSELTVTTSATTFLSSHLEMALCSSLTERLPLHSHCKQTLPWQTPKRSSGVVARLFAASTGFTSPLEENPYAHAQGTELRTYCTGRSS